MPKLIYRRPASLASRVTLFMGIVTTLVFTVFTWFIERSVDQHFIEQDFGEVQAGAQSIQRILRDAPDTPGTAFLQSGLAGAVAGHHGIYFIVINADGGQIYDTSNAILSSLARTETPVAQLSPDTLKIWTVNDSTYRGTVLNINGYTALVALGMDFHLQYLTQLNRALWIGTLAASLITILIAWITVQHAHKPIRRISARMRSITSEQLDVRLDPHSAPIELRELVLAFNSMLEKLEENFQRLSHFSADIAHEFRTPMTNLITQTQVALSQPREAARYSEILYSNLEEFDRLSKMIADMLFLAQADDDLIKPQSTDVDLREELHLLFEYFEGLSEEKNIEMVLEGRAPSVSGDRSMLRRAFSNLLSNAILHSHAGKTIRVEITATLDTVIVRIRNTGTITPEHLSRVFDRFYRVDPSRQRSSEGGGLGLAIVQSIVKAHHGAISVWSKDNITEFRIALPLAQSRHRLS